jgi:hypothetical protein
MSASWVSKKGHKKDPEKLCFRGLFAWVLEVSIIQAFVGGLLTHMLFLLSRRQTLAFLVLSTRTPFAGKQLS